MSIDISDGNEISSSVILNFKRNQFHKTFLLWMIPLKNKNNNAFLDSGGYLFLISIQNLPNSNLVNSILQTFVAQSFYLALLFIVRKCSRNVVKKK